MKLALVVHDFDLNLGHGRYAVEVARRMAKRVPVHIYANRFAVPPEPNLIYHRVPALRRTAITTIYSFLWWSEWKLRKQNYDLIHAQGLTCWRSDLITGHMCNAAKFKRLPPQLLRGMWFPKVIVPLERRFFQNPHARHLIAISHQFAEEIRENYGWTRPVSVIYHGTDTEVFRPPRTAEERMEARARYGLAPEHWVWLFMGEGVKGLRQVMEQLPYFPEAKLLVVSRSDPEPYKALAIKLKVHKQVIWNGPEKQPTKAYQAADVFVYPSDYDPFGLVVAEAMACGMPVIVGKNIGAAEWIEQGRNGYLCEPKEPDTLRDMLYRVWEHPGSTSHMGEAARQTVLENSWDKCAEATWEVYQQVLLQKGLAHVA